MLWNNFSLWHVSSSRRCWLRQGDHVRYAGLDVESATTKVRAVNKDDIQFLARVELEAEGIVGSYTKPKHDACLTCITEVD
jgi:hypothetical protein